MKDMRSLIAALLVFVGVVAVGIVWDLWPMLLPKLSPFGSTMQ